MLHKPTHHTALIACLLVAVLMALYGKVHGQTYANKTFVEDRPTMLFGSVVAADDGTYKVTGVTTGLLPNTGKALVASIDSAYNMERYRLFIDSNSARFGIFTNALTRVPDGRYAFTGLSYDSVPCLLFGFFNNTLDSIEVFKYYTATPYSYRGISLLYLDEYYYVTGVHNATGYNANVLLAKIDLNGIRVWERYYDSYKLDFAESITTLPSGNLLIGAGRQDLGEPEKANTWLLEVDTGGNLIRQWFDPNDSTYNAKGILKTKDGGYVFGTQKKSRETINSVFSRAWMVKLDSNFNELWHFTYGGIGLYSLVNDIVELQDGSYVACGSIPGYELDSNMVSGWVFKLSSAGDILWNRKYVGMSQTLSINQLSDIDMLPDGSFVAVGQCQNTTLSPPQVGWFLRLDSNGCEIENCLVGVDDPLPTNQVRVYPNPFISNLSISLTGENAREATFIITDIQGKEIYRQYETNLAPAYTKVLDLSKLTAGIYFVRVEVDGQVSTQKVVKQ